MSKNHAVMLITPTFLLRICSVLLFLVSYDSAANTPKEESQSPFRVAFVSPNPKSDDFWQQYAIVMQSAARQLGIELSIYYASSLDRFSYVDAVEKAIKSKQKPNYLVAMFRYNTSQRMLELTADAGVKLFSTNSDLPTTLKKSISGPRSDSSHWIGQMFPDDSQGGYTLAQQINQETHSDKQQPIELVAIAGSHDSPVSFARIRGLERYIADNPAVRLKQILYSDWRYETAFDMVPQILARYPGVNAFWSASDVIASAIDESLQQSAVNQSYVIGGFDWNPTAFKERVSNNNRLSVGGHFIEGGMILALINDYHHGYDFADQLGKRLVFKLSSLNAADRAMVKRLVLGNEWHRLEFNRLSKQQGGSWDLIDEEYINTMRNIYMPPESPEIAVDSE